MLLASLVLAIMILIAIKMVSDKQRAKKKEKAEQFHPVESSWTTEYIPVVEKTEVAEEPIQEESFLAPPAEEIIIETEPTVEEEPVKKKRTYTKKPTKSTTSAKTTKATKKSAPKKKSK